MRETQFIRQNQEEWAELERVLQGQRADPEKLSRLFVKATDDLSYSRTYYPNRSVRVYLNFLAQRIFLRIYRRATPPQSRFVWFWQAELPRLVYEHRAVFGLSLAVFLLFFGVGMLSCAMDDEFLAIILGSDYVEMTRANIASGDPMAVYKQMGTFDMFYQITLNNLMAALITFAGGLFFGLGTFLALIYNSVMVGAFQYFFVEQGLFWESFLTIWIHGTLEISSLVIAASAGMILAKGLVFPGTYTRAQAFQRSARAGVKVFLGTLPIFIVAAFFEGYLTRHTELPDAVRALFILLCATAVFFYFVWYPYYRHRRGLHEQPIPDSIPERPAVPIQLNEPKTIGMVLTDAFVLIGRRHQGLLLRFALITLVHTALLFAFASSLPVELFSFIQGFGQGFYNLPLVYQYQPQVLLIPLWNVLSLWILCISCGQAILQEIDQQVPAGAVWRPLLPISIVGILLAIPMAWSGWLVSIGSPWLLLWAISSYLGTGGLPSSLHNSGRTLGFFFIIVLLSIALILLMDTFIFSLIFGAANWVISGDQAMLNQWSVRITALLTLGVANLIWSMFFLSFGLLSYTQREIRTAQHLRTQFQQLGTSRQVRGILREAAPERES